MRLWYTAALICLLSSGPAVGRILRVPSQISSIQTAINTAVSGDTVLVDHGIYYEHLNYYGKAITVGSRVLADGDGSHVAATVVDGSHPGKGDTESVAIFCHGESARAQLRGFTLRNGSGTPITTSEWGEFNAGNELLVVNGSPTISDCVMADVFVMQQAGPAAPVMVRCQVANLSCQENGATTGNACVVANADIRNGGNMRAAQSTVTSVDIETGGDVAYSDTKILTELYCYYSTATSEKCTVGGVRLAGDGAIGLSNSLVQGDVVAGSSNGGVALHNCTVLGQVTLEENCLGSGEVTYSIVVGGIVQAAAAMTIKNTIVGAQAGLPMANCAHPFDTVNVVVQDPRFCSTAGTYTITDGSPAAPGNNISGQLIGAFGVGCSCCVGKRGNLDGSAVIDLADLSQMISYLTVKPTPQLTCPTSADIDGQGTVDLGDLSILIGYMVGRAGSALPSCPVQVAQEGGRARTD